MPHPVHTLGQRVHHLKLPKDVSCHPTKPKKKIFFCNLFIVNKSKKTHWHQKTSNQAYFSGEGGRRYFVTKRKKSGKKVLSVSIASLFQHINNSFLLNTVCHSYRCLYKNLAQSIKLPKYFLIGTLLSEHIICIWIFAFTHYQFFDCYLHSLSVLWYLPSLTIGTLILTFTHSQYFDMYLH